MNFIIASGPSQDTVVCVDSGPPPPPSLSPVWKMLVLPFALLVCGCDIDTGLLFRYIWHREGSSTEKVCAPLPKIHIYGMPYEMSKNGTFIIQGYRIKVLTSLWVWPGRHCMCVSVSPYVWMTGISNDEDISRQPVCRLHRVRLRRRQITCRLAPILYLGTYCDIKFNISVLFWDEMTHPSSCGVALSQNVFRTLLLL